MNHFCCVSEESNPRKISVAPGHANLSRRRYARAGSGGAAGPPAATKSRDRTSAYPATEPTAATATLTSAIVLKPVTNAWCAAFTTLSRSAV
jgi:hypothetical protein